MEAAHLPWVYSQIWFQGFVGFSRSHSLISCYALNVECEVNCFSNDYQIGCVCVYACTHTASIIKLLFTLFDLYSEVFQAQNWLFCKTPEANIFPVFNHAWCSFWRYFQKGIWRDSGVWFNRWCDVCKMPDECRIDVIMWLSLLIGWTRVKCDFELCNSAGNRIESPYS